MALRVNHRFLGAILVAGMMLILASTTVEADGKLSNPEGWIDKLVGFVMIQKGMETEGNFDLYLEELGAIRSVFRTELPDGELYRTYTAMNHFMDMLEAREGGIRTPAAEVIWNWCYQVTPLALHDAARHRGGFTVGDPEKLEGA